MRRANAGLTYEQLQFTKNLLAEVVTLTPAEIDKGRAWWGTASLAVQMMANVFDKKIEVVRCAAATLSPGVSWNACLENLNILMTAMAFKQPMPQGPGCGLEVPLGYRQIQRAWDMLAGLDPPIARGPKVEAYARNLAGDFSIATVDRHMIRIATLGAAQVGSVQRVKEIRLALEGLCAIRHQEPAIVMAALWLRRDGGTYNRRSRAQAKKTVAVGFGQVAEVPTTLADLDVRPLERRLIVFGSDDWAARREAERGDPEG